MNNEEKEQFRVNLSNMKIELKHIKDRLEKIPTREEMEKANLLLVEKVMKESDKKFASKLTEKVVYGLVGLVLAGFLWIVFRVVTGFSVGF